MSKRFLTITLAAVFGVILCSCLGSTAEVKVDLGTSELYTENDLHDAAEAIKKQFLEFEGCTLHSLTYAGDERSNKEAEYHISHDIIYDEYAVFDSSFHSPKKSGGAWTTDTEYTWSWILGRNNKGVWKVINYGYC
ncbi:MAG: hypothetical protein IKG47_05390 [Oscillospiraceae bacterium]|nr:hypothetical protein [Oscillospiraceae bacterium]